MNLVARRLHHIFWKDERVLCVLIELAKISKSGVRLPVRLVQYRYYAGRDSAWIEFFPEAKRTLAFSTWAVIWPVSYLRRMQIPVMREFKTLQDVVFNGGQPDDPQLLLRPKILRRIQGTPESQKKWQPIPDLPVEFN